MENREQVLKEMYPEDILKFIALAVVCEILLVVGYRRNENEDITD